MSGAEDFGEYEVQKREDGSLFELGRGAMGVTYKAFDTNLHRFVALKTISPAVMAHPDAEERFTREARSAAQLRHPNIAAVFRRDKTPEGTHFYAMEFCEGRTIEQLVTQEGALEWRRALGIAAQAANALAAAARRNLIHRDIKPSNLMLVRDGEEEGEGEVLKVIDFGLAKMTAADGAAWSSLGTQGFVGTAHFASPEQIQNGIVDTRTDIYSLGATLWFMLLGSPPFAGSVWEVISKHVTSSPDFSLLRAAPEKVVDLVREMMAKSPADRPQTARELLDKIKKCLHRAPDAEPALDTQRMPRMQPIPGEQQALAGWAPSLRDLLRARRILEPAEALRLGEALAAILDMEDAAGASRGALLIHEISIHFRDPLSARDARAKLREPVTTWPRFNLAISVSDNRAAAETVVSGGNETVFTRGDPAADRVQQLARLLYELLGGVAGSQYAPLASLGEKGNEVLQRGIVKGLREYPRARDLIDAFGAAKADNPGPRPGSRGEFSVSRAESESPYYSYKPLPASRREPTVGRVESESPRYSYEPRPASRQEPTAGRPERKRKISPIKRRTVVILAIVGAAVALTSFAVFGWIKLPFSGRIPAHADNFASSNAPKVRQADESEKRKAKPPLTVTSGPKQVAKVESARSSLRVLPPASSNMPRSGSTGISATKKAPFVNSLRMEFVPAGMHGVLFCRTDTRVRDFRQYAEETNLQQTGGIYALKLKTNMDASHSLEWGLDFNASWERPGFSQTDDDPVVGVSWNEARDFCDWLSAKEGRSYRLPTDEEWSAAVGSGAYPWGNAWPPSNGAGNYADQSFLRSLPGSDWTNELGNYYDFYPRTSPVGRFKANAWGLFDMGGNVWQWCEDKYRASMNDLETLEKYPALRNERASDGTPYRVVRGGAWDIDDPTFLRSTFRNFVRPASRGDAFGFRCVLVVPGG
jgi:serine/threonine protein kinase/formylglycine-generating enzyme required for sulfatase activity